MSSTPPASRPEPVVVGREPELATLTAALEEACAGRGGLVLLTGEPGIGKTTLAGALAVPALGRGARMVWGRAWDAGGAPAYWPWRQVVRVLAAGQDAAALTAAAGAGGRWLVRIDPDLDARLPGADPAVPAESQQASFLLFEALAGYLAACAREGPLVLALDDLHVADVASLRALDFVARTLPELPLLIVCTLQEPPLRRRPDAARVVETLARRARRVPLHGLDAAAVGRLLAARDGTAPAGAVVRLVHDRSAGNPLFAHELARGRPDPTGAVPLPDGVHAAVRDRLLALGEEGVSVLTMAAVIGQEFRVLTLERATDLPRARVLDLLDDAEALGVVRAQDEGGRFRFTHGVLRDALYQGLRRSARAAAHLKVGGVLEELHAGGAPDRHLSELAHHHVEAASLGDPAPGVRFSRAAGERAMAVLAFEQAADHFATALRVMELGPPDEAARSSVLLDLGRARAAAGHPDAEATLRDAAALARELGDAELLADVALAYGPYALSPGTVDDAWTGLLEQAIAAVGDADPARRARLLAQLGRALYFAPGADARRRALADEAVALARGTGDARTLADVLGDAHVAAWEPGRTHRNLEWIAELAALYDALGDPRAALPSLVRSIDLHLELGDVVAADIALERLEARAAELGDVRAAVLAQLHRSRRAIVAGRFAECGPLIAAAAERGGDLRYSPVPILVGAQTVTLRLLCGGLEQFEGVVRQAADAIPNLTVWRAALTQVLAELGRADEARAELDRAAAGGFAALPHDNFRIAALVFDTEAAYRLGLREHADALHAQLAPFAGRLAITTGAVFLGPVDRPLGLLAALRGDGPAALTHLAAAREQARRIGSRPALALTDAAEAEIRARLLGDAEGARACAAAAAAVATELGMAPVLARVATLEAELGAGGDGGPPTGAAAAAAPAAAGRGQAGPPRGASVVAEGRLVREGDTWALALGPHRVRLRDAKGVRLLATLLEHPGVEHHVLELAGAPAGGGPDAATAAAVAAGALGARPDPGDAGPLLDAAAKAAYAERIGDLREAIEEAERFNDPERAASAREELGALTAQLAAAVGLGGRDRPVAAAAERARVNVTRALRGTLRRIAEHDAALGADLDACVRTGLFCSYVPSALHPVTWTVDRGSGGAT